MREFFYPKGGWLRASSYIWHRLRRLPDSPQRIARGIAAGVFVSFTPLFGFHFLLAGLIAFLIRGNILAALIATFAGNPMTTPIIATASLELGYRLLHLPGHMPLHRVAGAFSQASVGIWHNVRAVYTDEVMDWSQLTQFWDAVFLPYLVGGLAPGILAGGIAYALSIPLITAYQKARRKRLEKRFRKTRAETALREGNGNGPQSSPGPAPDGDV